MKRQRDIHRRFWILAIANWCVAVACWGISAYLGVASPTNLFVYTILFVVAMVAVIVGVLAWLVARFGVETLDEERTAVAVPGPAEAPAGTVGAG